MILLYLALVVLGGIGLLRFLWPAPPRAGLHTLLIAGMGAGTGIGIASALYFLCLVTFGPNRAILAGVEGIFVIAGLALGAITRRRGPLLEWAPAPQAPFYLPLLLAGAVALGIVMFVFYTLMKPHGEWDAWSIWNLRARFLVRSGTYWQDAFSRDLFWSHPDYPLLLPGMVAMLWTLAKSEWTGGPAGIGFVFTFATIAVLVASLGILKGKTQALAAGILLLGTVPFLQVGAMQYADVPLSFYFLCAIALLCLQDRYPDDPRFSLLAGLSAGFAAWTKNEGLMFVAVLILARGFAIVRYGDRGTLAPQFLKLAAGLGGPVALVAFFKLRYAPPNDLISGSKGVILTHIADVSRWLFAIEGFVKMSWRFGGFLIPVVVLLVLYWFLVRIRVDQPMRLPVATALNTVLLMLAGDFAVYILFPADVAWQLNTSLDRIFLQLWPAGLLAFFLAANVPELAPATKDAPDKPKSAKKPARAARR